MRIAIGGIQHESNTFSSAKTTFADFGVQRGAEILDEWGPSQHEMGGFIEGASRFGFEIYPTLMAVAMPAGAVTNDALDRLTAELIDRIKAAPPLDAVLLALHGAQSALLPRGIKAAEEHLRRCRSAEAMSWLMLALDAHGEKPDRGQAPAPPCRTVQDHALAVLAKAAGAGRNLFLG